jgi:hypothetical protein
MQAGINEYNDLKWLLNNHLSSSIALPPFLKKFTSSRRKNLHNAEKFCSRRNQWLKVCYKNCGSQLLCHFFRNLCSQNWQVPFPLATKTTPSCLNSTTLPAIPDFRKILGQFDL